MTSDAVQSVKGNAKRGIAIMLLGVALPFLLGVDALWPFFASHQTEWSRVIDERVHATAAATAGPKVLFVGGSNVIFGVRPRTLAERIGMPVVAYGANAGIGLDLIVERAEGMVGPGDVVVLAPELHHFTRRGAIDRPLRGDWLVLFGNRSGDWLGRFPLRQWVATRERCKRIVQTLENRWAQEVNRARARWRGSAVGAGPFSVYEIASIDAQGYNTFPRREPARNVNWQAPNPRAQAYDWSNSNGAMAVRRMGAVCRERGATFLIMPAVRATGGPLESAAYLSIVAEREQEMLRLAESVGAAQLLGAGTAVVEKEYVFDTSYHLNDRGTSVIEDRLDAALRPWAAKQD